MKQPTAQFNINGYEAVLVYKRIVSVCASLIAVFAIVYVYALCSTVHFVLARGDSQSQIQKLQVDLGTLQSQYVAQTEAITLDRGTALGLHAATHVSFTNQISPAQTQLSFVDTHEL